jgi:glutamate-1-semialdehyde aminotransferase
LLRRVFSFAPRPFQSVRNDLLPTGLERGVLFHPSAYENLFLPTAHSREDVAVTLAAASDVADALARAA